MFPRGRSSSYLPVCSFALLVSLALHVPATNAQTVSSSGNGAASSAPVTSTPGTVSGHVVNTLTGESVPGAALHLRSLRSAQNGDDNDPQATSSGDGSFVFSQVPPGTYLLRADKDGFITTPLNRQVPFITISSGETKNDVGVQLTPQATLSGRVMDDEGKPVVQGRVAAYISIAERGRAKLQRAASTYVDSSGKFFLPRLKSGSYYLMADPNADRSNGARSQAGSKPAVPVPSEFARTFFPNSVDLNGAGTLQVTAGQGSSDVTINMRRLATHRLQGKLAELPPGMQATNLQVSLNQEGAVDMSALAQTAKVAPDGHWSIENVVPGAYTLELSGLLSGTGAPGGMRPHAPLGEQHVELGGTDVDNIVLNVDPPLQLNGSISVEGSNSNAVSLSRVRVVARPQSDIAHSTFAFVNVGADGKFALSNLNREPYVINILSSGTGLYPKTVDMGGQNILLKEVDLSQMSGADIHVVLQSGAGQISGTVLEPSKADTNTGSIRRAAIVLVPQMLAPDASNVTFAYTRGSTSFSFADLTPGNYWLFALDFADPNVWQNPDFLLQIQSAGTPIAIPENGQVTVQVPRLPMEQIDAASQRVGLGSS